MATAWASNSPSVGELVRVYVPHARQWRVCQVDTAEDGELECSDVETGEEISVAAERAQFPLDHWLQLPWRERLGEAHR